jgi:hypothetical protein
VVEGHVCRRALTFSSSFLDRVADGGRGRCCLSRRGGGVPPCHEIGEERLTTGKALAGLRLPHRWRPVRGGAAPPGGAAASSSFSRKAMRVSPHTATSSMSTRRCHLRRLPCQPREARLVHVEDPRTGEPRRADRLTAGLTIGHLPLRLAGPSRRRAASRSSKIGCWGPMGALPPARYCTDHQLR